MKRRRVINQARDAYATGTAAQEQRIVKALRIGPKTTDELRALGCYQVSARIFGLRRRGYDIATSLYDGYAADGYSHKRLARYELVSEPAPNSKLCTKGGAK